MQGLFCAELDSVCSNECQNVTLFSISGAPRSIMYKPIYTIRLSYFIYNFVFVSPKCSTEYLHPTLILCRGVSILLSKRKSLIWPPA